MFSILIRPMPEVWYIFLGAYNFLDITQKGRDEEGLAHTMSWVRHHDKYERNHEIRGRESAVCGARENARLLSENGGLRKDS